MKKFIELTGLDENNQTIDVLVDAKKIIYMSKIDGNCNENSSLSTIIHFENNQCVRVIESVFAVSEIIEEKNLMYAQVASS